MTALYRTSDVTQAIEAAFAYRHHFRKDVIVDLIVYRRWFVVQGVCPFPAKTWAYAGDTTNWTSRRSLNP